MQSLSLLIPRCYGSDIVSDSCMLSCKMTDKEEDENWTEVCFSTYETSGFIDLFYLRFALR